MYTNSIQQWISSWNSEKFHEILVLFIIVGISLIFLLIWFDPMFHFKDFANFHKSKG